MFTERNYWDRNNILRFVFSANCQLHLVQFVNFIYTDYKEMQAISIFHETANCYLNQIIEYQVKHVKLFHRGSETQLLNQVFEITQKILIPKNIFLSEFGLKGLELYFTCSNNHILHTKYTCHRICFRKICIVIPTFSSVHVSSNLLLRVSTTDWSHI